MKHDFLDKYSGLESPIHSLNPQIKTVVVLALLVFISLTPIDRTFFYFSLIFLFFVLLFLSRVPFVFIFLRSLIILPIILVISFSLFFSKSVGSFNPGSHLIFFNQPQLFLFLSVLLKSWLSIFYLSLLVSTTHFSEILKSLEKLGLPPTLLGVLSFLYRYLFLFVDQGERMARAFYSRGKTGKARFNIRIFGNLLGVLFLRSYERSERVYQAMLARGYKGDNLPSSPLAYIKTHEVAFLVFVLGFFFISSLRW